MTTSLEAITKKATSDKKHRFQNLYGMLNETYLLDCWQGLNKQSAVEVDGVSARAYEKTWRRTCENWWSGSSGGGTGLRWLGGTIFLKEPGKMRPLGIPATEDKLLQLGAARILQAIWEEDFLASSFGYRPE